MKRFLIFAISIMAFIPSFSQDSKVKRPDSYNYQRGVEAIQKARTARTGDRSMYRTVARLQLVSQWYIGSVVKY